MKSKCDLLPAWLLGALFLLLPAVVQAQTYTNSYGIWGYATNADGITLNITGYTGSGGSVTIPANIDDLTVTGIGTNAFHNCTNLISVTVPDSVTNIGFQAFNDCNSLTNAIIGTNVTSIGDGVFEGCFRLMSITIPNSVISIGEMAFYNCSHLNNVTIPNNVTNIEDYAFCYCSSLTSATIPDSVTSIGARVFLDCTSLTNVTIGKNVTNIGFQALAGCTSLTEIMVATNNPAYSSADGALFNKNQTTLIQYPEGKVGSYTIPNSVTNIGEWAFSGCTSLTNVTISSKVTSLGDDAFYGCTGTTNVTIGNNVTNIGFQALADCTGLKEIIVATKNPAYSSVDGVLFNKSQTTLIQYPEGKIGSYTIPNSVTNIGEYAFAYCTSLTNITIPGSVTILGSDAFGWCTSLIDVTIGNNVTNIGFQAFAFCTSLAGVYFQGNAPSADSSVFEFDNNPTVYYLPGTMGWGATFGGVPAAEVPGAILTVSTNGVGSLSTNYNGALLLVGNNYAITATAAKGFGFVNWMGGTNLPLSILTNGPTLDFVMASNLVLQANFADIILPTLSITSPKTGQKWSNAVFTVTGKSGDNVAVSNVMVSVTGGSWVAATLLNNGSNWTEQVPLTPGTNTISVYAVDSSGNVSLTNAVKLDYILSALLTVQIVGEGTLKPDYNGQFLVISNSYTMKATAASGFGFYYWSGGVPMSTNKALTFTMVSNLTITANFKDVKKPKATITFPVANQKWSNTVITVSGKASDNVGVAGVWVQINGGGWVAAGTGNVYTNWSATNLAVFAGNNLVQVYAEDAAGNLSLTNEVKFIANPPNITTSDGMALIPAGSFKMGDTLDDWPNAIPTNVYVSAIYVDTNLVSYSQWQGVYNYATANGYSFDYDGSGKASNHPVQTVNWYDVVKWCNARSQQAGLTPVYYTDAGFTQVYTNGDIDITNANVNWAANGYRLPTEAEWEKAARGGHSNLRFPWGNTISWSQANYLGEPSPDWPYDLAPIHGWDPTFNDGVPPYTSPVGYFAANGYGLYDMAGNVEEWCWDWYGTPYGQPTTTNPTGPATGSLRMLRGGCWEGGAIYARCANRLGNDPNSPDYPEYQDGTIGFRCVRGF